MRLVLDLHCHQPVGNFGWVFQQATGDCYRPLLECLERHPGVRFVWHASGPLLEWWAAEAPEVLDLLERAVGERRVELQCAGMYEPILPAIPPADRRRQIAWHQDWLRERFGVAATSLWLTERVWEPCLARDLGLAGIQAVPLDDHHFAGAGLRGTDLHRIWVTEDEGHAIRVVPTATPLRYLIPFQPVDEVRRWLREQADQGRSMVVFGDDGEKFGVWPGTREWVFEEGWLEGFLTMLEAERDWLETCTLRELCEAETPAGRIYLPTSSYEEMDRWCLPPSTQWALEDWEAQLDEAGLREGGRGAVRGAPWRNMLARYPEANRMHKRMLEVSRRLLEQEAGDGPAAWVEARRALFRGQCNCAYWHGVFGGLYLPFLREAVVGHLLEARRLLDGAEPVARFPRDMDADGQEEWVLEEGGWSLWVAPHRGGVVEVLDHLPSGKDLCHTMGRRPEAYHRALQRTADEAGPPAVDAAPDETGDAVAPEGPDPSGDPVADAGDPAAASRRPASIHHDSGAFAARHGNLFLYDRWPRGGFALFLFGAGQPAPDPGVEPTAGFVSGFHPVEGDGGLGGLVLEARCDDPAPLSVHRTYRIRGSALEVGIELGSEAVEPVRGRFLVRSDLSLPCIGSADRFVERPDGSTVAPDEAAAWSGAGFVLVDAGRRLAWEWSRDVETWMEPRWLASRGEAGVEESWQGLTLGSHGDFEVRRDRPWALSVRLRWEEDAS